MFRKDGKIFFEENPDNARRHLKLDTDFKEELVTNLGETFDFYRAVVVDGSRSLEEFRSLLTEKSQRRVSIAEVDDSNPFNFLLSTHNSESGFQNIEGLHLGEINSVTTAKALATEYLFVRNVGEPLYTEIREVDGPMMRHYRRLILPIFSGNKVVRLAIAHRLISAYTNVVQLSDYKKPD